MNEEKLYKITKAQTTLILSAVTSKDTESVEISNNLLFYFIVKGKHDSVALEKAYNTLLKINDSLRIKIIKKGGKYYQRIKPFEEKKIDTVYLENNKTFSEHLDTVYFGTPIYSTDDELVKGQIVEYDGNAALIIRCHHIISDGYSIALMLSQLQTIYTAFENGDKEPDIHAGSYVNYISEEKKYMESKQHTTDFIKIFKEYNSRIKYTIPGKKGLSICNTSEIQYKIDGKKYQYFYQKAKEVGCTVNFITIVLTALTTYKITKSSCFAVNSIFHGRTTPELKRTVGCMMTQTPIFFDIKKDMSVNDLFITENEKYKEIKKYGRLSMVDQIFITWIQGIKCGFNFNHSWINHSFMNIDGAVSDERLYGSFCLPKIFFTKFYDSVYEKKGEYIKFTLNYQNKLFSEKEINNIVSAFDSIVNSVYNNPEIKIKEL